MTKRSTLIGGSAAALTLALAGTGAGLALSTGGAAASPAAPAAHGSLATASAPTSGARPMAALRHRLRMHGLLRRTIHAELIIRAHHGFVTVDIDRGKIWSVSSTSITVMRPDGHSVSAAITPSTHFFGLPESKLVKGDRAIVVQTGGNAVDIGSRAPKAGTATATTA